MATVNDVERLIWILNISDVHLNHCATIEEIGREVSLAQLVSKPDFERPLGGDVKHLFRFAVKKIRQPLEVKPNEPMSLKYAAMRALSIIAFDDPEPTELTGLLLANRTEPFVPVIRDGDQPINKVADSTDRALGAWRKRGRN